MFKQLLQLFRIKPRPLRRWSPAKLADVKAYLAVEPPGGLSTAYFDLMTEYLVQRYWSDDPVITKKQMEALKQKSRDSVKAYDPERAARSWQRHPPSRYEMTEADFLTVIVPCLSAFNFFGDPHQEVRDGIQMWRYYFRLAQPYSEDYRQAKDDVLHLVDVRSITSALNDLCSTYQDLVRAKEDGCVEVRVSLSNCGHCEQCALLQDHVLSLQELLNSYVTGKPRFPHAIEWEDGIDWCRAPLLLGELPLKEGDDPEFHNWMKDYLRSKR